MHNVIIGSGPAAAAAILALADDPAQQITVVDIGERLGDDAAAAVDRMSVLQPAQWARADVDRVAAQPVPLAGSALPEKRAYGSNHMFIDRGTKRRACRARPRQPCGGVRSGGRLLDGLGRADHAVLPGPSSTGGPSGGTRLSRTTRACWTRCRWPPRKTTTRRTSRCWRHVPPCRPCPGGLLPCWSAMGAIATPSAPRATSVGKARLALAADSCMRCGLCMTGCPYSLIYSARQTLDRFAAAGRVRVISRVLVVRVDQPVGARPSVHGIDLTTGRAMRLDADRVFVGAGGLGSTRIALNSLSAPPNQVALEESAQLSVSFVSKTAQHRRPTRAASLHPQPVQPAGEIRRRGLHHLTGALLSVQPCGG